ncbi:MAG TPA: hypothetical protein DIW52_11325 [Pseudomonas sp.]|nr:hypothetical protein [Pseudomonas sp.]
MARELAPARLRSSRKPGECGLPEKNAMAGFGAASQPSGSKLPRHNNRVVLLPLRKTPPERTHGLPPPPFTLPLPELAAAADPRQRRS